MNSCEVLLLYVSKYTNICMLKIMYEWIVYKSYIY
jgi:hypothetical protein